jgi:GT2 family glycosyltransferase
MNLSIIIVNFRGWDDLATCLDSLAYLVGGIAPATEIIVVDNCSDDGCFGPMSERYQQVVFIENTGNHGFANGCNLGALNASGTQLLFLNPDARDPGHQVQQFLKIKSGHDDNTLLTVRQLDQNGKAQKVFDNFPNALTLLGPIRALLRLIAPKHYVDARRVGAARLEVDWVSGAALMIARSTFDTLGGWCDDYWMYSEDVDLCRRAKNKGFAVAYSGEINLEHRHGGTSRRNAETTALTKSEVIISRHLYAHRHLAWLHAALYHGLIIIFRYLPLAVAALVKGWWKQAPQPIHIRAVMFTRLSAYYRRIFIEGNWLSKRSINHKRSVSRQT